MLSYAVHALDHDSTKVILKPVVVVKLKSLVWAFYVTIYICLEFAQRKKFKKGEKRGEEVNMQEI